MDGINCIASEGGAELRITISSFWMICFAFRRAGYILIILKMKSTGNIHVITMEIAFPPEAIMKLLSVEWHGSWARNANYLINCAQKVVMKSLITIMRVIGRRAGLDDLISAPQIHPKFAPGSLTFDK
jgi:hypothetical protein